LDNSFVIIVLNFTPVLRNAYRIGVPQAGNYQEIFNSDAAIYGGSGVTNGNSLRIEASPYDGREYSVELTLPPLSVTVYKFN
jgi:1,4-alpha-glucan branching enzyme